MTKDELKECRLYLWGQGYGSKYCESLTETEIIQIMKKDYPISLEVILSKFRQ